MQRYGLKPRFIFQYLQAREDAATRKAAFDALQYALPRQEAARPPWSHFVALWKLLQQFPLHIVQEPFAQHMLQLRAGAPSGPANGWAETQSLRVPHNSVAD